MEYGHVCFSYTKDEFIPKAISWFTKSKWSHTFITVPAMLGKELVLECGGNGVDIVMFDQAYRDNTHQSYEVYRVKVDKDTIDQAVLKCMDRLETSYGYLEYPWFMWRSVNRWFGRDIKDQDNWSTDKEVCAGLVDIFVDELGLQVLTKDFGNNSVNAQDLYEIVLANPNLFNLIEKKN